MSASSTAVASFVVVLSWASSSVGCDISNAVRGSKVVVERCGGNVLPSVDVWAWSSLRASDSFGVASIGGVTGVVVGTVAMVRSGLSFPSAVAEGLESVGFVRVTVNICGAETTTAVVCGAL